MGGRPALGGLPTSSKGVGPRCQASTGTLSRTGRTRGVQDHPDQYGWWWAARSSIPAPWDPLIGTYSGSPKCMQAAQSWCAVQARPWNACRTDSLGCRGHASWFNCTIKRRSRSLRPRTQALRGYIAQEFSVRHSERRPVHPAPQLLRRICGFGGRFGWGVLLGLARAEYGLWKRSRSASRAAVMSISPGPSQVRDRSMLSSLPGSFRTSISLARFRCTEPCSVASITSGACSLSISVARACPAGISASAASRNSADDIRLVMDDAGWERAHLFGISEGGPLSLLFAATYPERVQSLSLYGSFACLLPDDDPASAEFDVDRYLNYVESNWGNGQILGAFVHAPPDPAILEQLGRFERACASPRLASQILRHNLEIDARPILGSISAPVLVVHRLDDPIVGIERAREMVAGLPQRDAGRDPGRHALWLGRS